ncbi:putative N-hydroxyarylamine O-acetyltransferase [Sorangium cellulosum So ce56]|uniref:N-hydroxyarylamine O-acetyltransferase n=1 Tax=Sorangium cellulosum (strain So ce56) TaxID=448385 RepID=A9FX66_SORC5|nr:arylamine N-acetyltransferase [Sorangium cellulosum]CAN95485.1 putative N-hydroxyarylamine O-acetyltransferase [Sorangium cellulosum So ce56]
MQPSTQDSASLDLDAYLARIGYRGALAATREVLDALHAAHVYSIPFENLDVLLGRPIRLDLASVQAKLVRARRGGYCFEHNTLFAAVLRRLGFKLTTLIARVRFQRSDTGPRSHMLSLVELPEGPFIADVGFGGPGLLQPLPLVEGEGHARVLDVIGLRREGSSWVLASRAGEVCQDIYAFTLEEHLPIDYEVANHYTSTHPSSLFVNNLIVALPSPEGRVTLRNRELGFWRVDGVERVSVHDDALLDVLRERFGLELPAGTRLSCAGLDS